MWDLLAFILCHWYRSLDVLKYLPRIGLLDQVTHAILHVHDDIHLVGTGKSKA